MRNGKPTRPSIQPTIRRQPLQSTLATEAAFLVAAEGTRRVEFVIGVRPDDAGAQFVHHLENFTAFVRPHARAQAVGNVVRALERLACRGPGNEAQTGFSFLLSAFEIHAQHRPENLLRRHAMRVRDARLRGRSRSVAAKAREKRLRDNSVENSVKHFNSMRTGENFSANLVKSFWPSLFFNHRIRSFDFQCNCLSPVAK